MQKATSREHYYVPALMDLISCVCVCDRGTDSKYIEYQVVKAAVENKTSTSYLKYSKKNSYEERPEGKGRVLFLFLSRLAFVGT